MNGDDEDGLILYLDVRIWNFPILNIRSKVNYPPLSLTA